ncbi:hypothetical protein QYE76_050756 [Lolium multiflorum]|uniref:DDE Tnp4 domain-containing protein n=1 Tax=Lolium multiflorum TaxID=4521 RepID=A0AAD8SS81_LOLMU|nr:hypothetical protein QYE76_050756 [Lolium multiflorum]
MTRTVDILSQDKRLIGGAGYPLMDWMLVPYSHQNLTHTHHEFNLKAAAARAVAVDAFQRLKTRWACLQKRCEFKVKNIPAILSACCALHNFCERRAPTSSTTSCQDSSSWTTTWSLLTP